MQKFFTSDLLQDKASTGKTKWWRAHGLKDSDPETGEERYWRQAEYWQTDAEGNNKSKVVFSEPYRVQPKNVGRANATNGEQQTILEVTSWAARQRDTGYRKEGEVYEGRTLGMLAHSKEGREKRMKYPCYAQPKHDGLRGHQKGCEIWSRKAKLLPAETVAHLFMQDTEDVIVDGEIMLPLPLVIQDTVSAVRKFTAEMSPLLEYHVYDVMRTDLNFPERLEIARRLVEKANNPRIIMTPTYLVNSWEEVLEKHQEFVAAGYEGTMIRQAVGTYKTGLKRDVQLLKYKDFTTEEYIVVDVVNSGEGKMNGCAKLICATPEGYAFEVELKLPIAERKQMLLDREQYLGKPYTIRYPKGQFTKDGVPKFAKGIKVREEDLEG